MTEGCTPLEVLPILELRDPELAVRCLEVIRLQLPSILPAGTRYRVETIALCHHNPDNVYPAFGVFGDHTQADYEDAESRITAWVAERGLDWLVEYQVLLGLSWGFKIGDECNKVTSLPVNEVGNFVTFDACIKNWNQGCPPQDNGKKI